MASDEFDRQLKKFFNQKIKDKGEAEVVADENGKIHIHDQIQILRLNSVKIDGLATAKSFLPCQVTVRCVKNALDEKFFGKDLAAARAAGEEERARAAAEEAAKKARAAAARKAKKGNPK